MRYVPGVTIRLWSPPRALRERPLKAAASFRLLVLSALLLSCAGSASRPPEASQEVRWEPLPSADEFSAERAWSDLNTLSRVSGSAAVRTRLRASLWAMGLRVNERVTPRFLESGAVEELVHLEVLLPGESSDRFVLVAPYGSPEVGDFEAEAVRQDLSGAALLLELTRALRERRPAYSIQAFFLEGEGLPAQGEERLAGGRGSELVAASMAERGELEGIRLLVVFDRVCGTELRVARDLLSQRHHRERFWRVARELGYGHLFPSERSFESVAASHRPFAELGLRPVLAIADSRYGASEPERDLSKGVLPDPLADCAPESLGGVGAVSLASLRSIGEQLEKIDRFAAQPRATHDDLATAASPSLPADPVFAP